jgi:hypothetical protein
VGSEERVWFGTSPPWASATGDCATAAYAVIAISMMYACHFTGVIGLKPGPGDSADETTWPLEFDQ